jgi:hypothetical protein
VKGHAHSQGDQARNLHKTSEMQEILGRRAEAEVSRRLAEEHRVKWELSMEGQAVNLKKFDGSEEAWDSLVCFFWR